MNAIQVGDCYELLYWDGEWVSLGAKGATTTCLDYNNVPKNALLWLRDRTTGREERIFTYKNGRQMWW